jgi:hypothetical protein
MVFGVMCLTYALGVDCESLQYWANIAQIVGAVGILIAAAAFVISWLQLEKSEVQLKKTEVQLEEAEAQFEKSAKWTRGAMIFAIDEALAHYDDVRALVRQAKWEPPIKKKGESKEEKRLRFRVHMYMGVFERIEQLIEDETIDPEVAEQFYGERARKLMNKKGVQQYLANNPTEWTLFGNLQRRLLSS